MKTSLLVLLTMAMAPIVAFAVDGVTLINQATVMAAGGFPYIISQPGSYKLSGNLAVPVATDGIHVTVRDVVLDLNGFVLSLTRVSFNAPASSAVGISGLDDQISLTVRNGTIKGFVTPVSGSTARLEELIIYGDQSVGGSLSVSLGGQVNNLTSYVAVLVLCPAILTNVMSYSGGIASVINPSQCVGSNNYPAFP